jgi:hypothetical protein
MNYTVLLALSGYAYAASQTPNLSANMAYRLSWVDLNGVVAATQVQPDAIQIIEGSDVILDQCLSGAGGWQRDPLIFRLAHPHPVSSIGCREIASPGLHVIFYRQPDGSRQAWAHFDLFGAGNRFAHGTEVIQNDLTLGLTSQADVRRGLMKRHEEPRENMPPLDYDFAQSFRDFTSTTYAPSSIFASLAESSAGPQRYGSRMEGALVRTGLQETIEFASSAVLQQNERYETSGAHGAMKRIGSAFYHAFFVQGRNGEDEFAFPRVAAAFGTGWVEQNWHPGHRSAPDAMKEASIVFSTYVARSFWHEFKPDLRNRLRLLR